MAYPKDGNRRYLIPSQEGETRIEADCEYGAWLECAVLTLRSPSPPPTPSVRTPRAKALAHRSGTGPSRPHRTSSAQHGNKPHKPGQKHIPPKPCSRARQAKPLGSKSPLNPTLVCRTHWPNPTGHLGPCAERGSHSRGSGLRQRIRLGCRNPRARTSPDGAATRTRT